MSARDRYQRPTKEQRAEDVKRARARLAVQRECAADIISRSYHEVAGGAGPETLAAAVVELAEQERRNP